VHGKRGRLAQHQLAEAERVQAVGVLGLVDPLQHPELVQALAAAAARGRVAGRVGVELSTAASTSLGRVRGQPPIDRVDAIFALSRCFIVT